MSEELTVGGYELKNCVASGATTQIWEVAEPGSSVQLAMKLILDEHRKDSAHRAALKYEFKVGQSLEHPNFLQFYKIEINRDHSFFVMDFYRSPSLKTHITSNLVAIQSSFKKMAESLAQGFQYMHESGWLHRDIKPDNILVNRAGETRIIDFNLATRVKGALGMMMAGKSKNIQGTRTYIAPETILRKAATPQTDMYSLGVAFFEVLTGAPPFAGDSPNALLKKHLGGDVVEPSAINDNVTKEMDKIILRCLEKNPKKRFESMEELAREIQKVRVWEKDPLELQEEEQKARKELAAMSVDKRLDSRADAERTSKGLPAPEAPKKKKRVNKALIEEEERRKKEEEAKKAAAAQPAAGAPGMPMPGQPMPGQPMPGQPMPGMYPGMPMPGQMMPGMYPGMPGQPMPGMPQPMPGQMMPGQPMPGQMMPGQPMPGQPMPGMPQPMPGQPMPGMPQPQMPQQPQPAPQQPVQPPPAAAQPAPPAPQQPAQPQPAAPQPPAEPAPAAEPEEPQELSLDDFNIE